MIAIDYLLRKSMNISPKCIKWKMFSARNLPGNAGQKIAAGVIGLANSEW